MKLTNKRLVSILLCLAMVLAMLPMAVFAATDYYLRGSMNGWAADDSNKMTDNGDGTYSITMDLAAGSYEFKGAVADWSWSCPGGSNMTLTLDADDTVTFTLNPTANTLNYTLGSGTVVETSYYLRGSMNDWGATDANKMTKNEDGTYSITMDLVAGTYTYKAAIADWSWSCPSGDNASLTLDADDTVTFTLDLAANTLTYTLASGAVVEPDPMVIESVYAVGTGSGNFLYGVEWDPASSFNVMDGVDNVYTITYMNVAAGTYGYKFAANGTWDISWGTGCETVAGETYDAWFNGSDNTLNVAVDGSTVTLTLDLSAMDFVTGAGAKCSVTIEEPAVSSAPEALVLGSNDFSIANGDTNAVTSTYVVEKAGVLSVNVSAMTTPDGEVPEAYIPMQFGRMYALLVNGEQVWLPCEIEVAAGDEVTIGVQSYMGSETSATIDLAIREPGVNDIKWQLNADATADSKSVDLRLISWVDSLDYQNVTFVVTIDGQTAELACETVYTGINSNGAVITDLTMFNDTAAYFVTYTIEGLEADFFGSEITVTMNWTDLEGNVTESETRTIVVSDAF